MSRRERRKAGFRGRAFASTAPQVPPRFVRRHGHKVVNVDWTVRSAYPARRERKIVARIARLLLRRGLVTG